MSLDDLRGTSFLAADDGAYEGRVTPRKVSFSTLSDFSSPEDDLLMLYGLPDPGHSSSGGPSSAGMMSSEDLARGYPLTGSVSEMDIKKMTAQARLSLQTSDLSMEELVPPSSPSIPRRRASEPEFKRRASLGMEVTLQKFIKQFAATDLSRTTRSPARPASPEVKETHVIDKTTDESGYKRINKYIVVQEIGRGVHGKVKLCVDLETNLPYVTALIPLTSSYFFLLLLLLLLLLCTWPHFWGGGGCHVLIVLRLCLTVSLSFSLSFSLSPGHEDCEEAHEEEVWSPGVGSYGEAADGDSHSQEV